MSEKLCSATKTDNHASSPKKTLFSVLAGAWYYFMYYGNCQSELKRSQFLNPNQWSKFQGTSTPLEFIGMALPSTHITEFPSNLTYIE